MTTNTTPDLDLQWIVIECPYAQWNNPMVQQYFNQFITVKKMGFEKAYPEGVLPLGTYDFIGTILMIVDKKTGKPLCALKSTTQKRCAEYHLTEELTSHLRVSNARAHLTAIEDVFKKAKEQNKLVSYLGSWATHPDVAHHEFKKISREASMALTYHYYTSFEASEILAGASPRFKVPEVLMKLGYELLKDHEQKLLPALTSPFLFGEPYVLVHLKNFSAAAKLDGAKYQALWDQRIELRLPVDFEVKKAA